MQLPKSKRSSFVVMAALAAATFATSLVVGVPSASAAFGPDGHGQVRYGTTCDGKGFTYQGSEPVGASGLVRVWRNEATKQDCVRVDKVGPTVGKRTATALIVCSTSLVTDAAADRAGGVHATDAQCQQGLTDTVDPAHYPSDWGNYRQYAGTVTIPAAGCLYIAAYTSTAADPTPKTYKPSEFKGREVFRNTKGSHRWGC